MITTSKGKGWPASIVLAASVICHILRILLSYIPTDVTFLVAQALALLSLIFFVIGIIRLFSQEKQGRFSVINVLTLVIAIVFGFLPSLGELIGF